MSFWRGRIGVARDCGVSQYLVRIAELPRRAVCRVEPSTPLDEVYRRLDEEHGVAVLAALGTILDADVPPGRAHQPGRVLKVDFQTQVLPRHVFRKV